ncbi:hypothetical protein G7Y79_00024g056170 [Physcia stellaris]|nr:hypothetical protein G7Y79_00024g056170 [Physcia stellaris]
MGFPAAFLSGITLTSSILYLSLLHHNSNRIHQASLLRQQSHLLNSLLDTPPPHTPSYDPATSHGRYAPDAAYTPDDPYRRWRSGGQGYRVERVGLVERWKEMWNRDVEGAVRWVQGVDLRGLGRGCRGG